MSNYIVFFEIDATGAVKAKRILRPLRLAGDRAYGAVKLLKWQVVARSRRMFRCGTSRGGGAVPVTLRLNVRNPWWCAALPILLGVLSGWVVRNWRASGRDLYFQLADQPT
jgi:hypothetical protein